MRAVVMGRPSLIVGVENPGWKVLVKSSTKYRGEENRVRQRVLATGRCTLGSTKVSTTVSTTQTTSSTVVTRPA
jgi:hypothetical protein